MVAFKVRANCSEDGYCQGPGALRHFPPWPRTCPITTNSGALAHVLPLGGNYLHQPGVKWEFPTSVPGLLGSYECPIAIQQKITKKYATVLPRPTSCTRILYLKTRNCWGRYALWLIWVVSFVIYKLGDFLRDLASPWLAFLLDCTDKTANHWNTPGYELRS